VSIITSARSFIRRVRHDGVRCLPNMVYTRWMTLIHRDVLRREKAARQAAEEAYQTWIREHEKPDTTPFQPENRLSFLIPTYNTRPEMLNALAESLQAQSCPSWEACFYDGASPDAATRAALEALAERDPRFRVEMGDTNGGISGNTNAAYTMATGEVIALCDHDDLLAPDAVRCILQAAEEGADFIYTDEDKVSEDGKWFFEPHLKADFGPDTLRSGNYICHITAMTRELAEALIRADGCLLRSAYDGSQDHDLALRATEKARNIVHIPRILYHWRMLDASFSHQKAEKCALAATAAVTNQLRRLKIPAKVSMEALRTRIWYSCPEARVTTIIVGEGRVPRVKGEVIRVGSYAEANEAAMRTQGDYLLFLSGDMKPLDKGWRKSSSMYACWSKGWLHELLMYAARPDVGCVGSAILDRRSFYRHAGYAVDVPGGAVSYHAGQWLYGHLYMITDRLVRNVTGVTSALLMIRRETFLSLGSFGAYESDLRGADLGLKCMQAGLHNVYTPHARMICRGAMSCLTGPAPQGDLELFRAAWGEHPSERYYSPLFTRDGRMNVAMKEVR